MNFQKRAFEQFQEDQKDGEDSSLLKVGPQDLIGRFKSKADIYIYFTEILSYYMPPIDGVNRDFLRQVLKGDKKLIKMGEVKIIKVPKYDELSVKTIYKNIKEDQDIVMFLPDMNENSKPIDREFFFNVINTISGEYLSHIIKQTQERRNGMQNDSQKKDYILMSDEWLQQLTAHPFISIFIEKNGRTIQLLKQSSKFFKARKPKQPTPGVLSLKRFKGLENYGSAVKPTNNVSIFENPFNETQLTLNDQNISKMRFNI